MSGEAKWWINPDPEAEAYEGPFASREAALAWLRAEGEDGVGVTLIRGRQAEVRLREHVHPEEVLECAEDSVEADVLVDQVNGGPLSVMSAEQKASLGTALAAALDAWQDAQGLRWESWAVTTEHEEPADVSLAEADR